MSRGWPQHLSTAAVASADRLAFWADGVCSTYVDLDCDAGDGARTVDGTIDATMLATLQLSRVTATAQRVRRTPLRIARASQDYFLVSIQTRGRGRIEQDGRCALLERGDFALYDSTRPYALHFDAPFQQFVLRLPGAALRTALHRTERLTATTVSGRRGAGHLMIGMIRSLAAGIDTLAPASAGAVAESVTQILVAGLAGLPAARQPAVGPLTAYHRARIRDCVERRLHEPGFGVVAIAAELGLSPSGVHRAWAGQDGSVGDWLRERRLDAARRMLCDPGRRGMAVGSIAYACGFNDAAHFSRAFRARFGCSARELRAVGDAR